MQGQATIHLLLNLISLFSLAFVIVFMMLDPLGKNGTTPSDQLLPSKLGYLNQLILRRLTKAREFRSQRRHSPVCASDEIETKCHRKITGRLPGGGQLGNQMFLLASVYGIAKTNKFSAVIRDQGNVFHALFEGMSMGTCEQICSTVTTTYEEDQAGFYKNETEHLASLLAENAKVTIDLVGYWQSWKYFDRYRRDIRSLLTFNQTIYAQALKVLTLFNVFNLSCSPTLVGVHVRDFGEGSTHSYRQSPKTYLEAAVRYFQKNYKCVLFIVATNNDSYAKNLLSSFLKDVHFMQGNEPVIDMAILTLMDHLILTAGTFGWWSAYLSDAQEVFYFRRWIKPSSQLAKQMRLSDYYYPKWKYQF